jgi:hypothetical protein
MVASAQPLPNTVFQSRATAGMAIRALGGSSSTAAASTYNATATGIGIKPMDSSLCLAMVVNSKASAPDIPTFSGYQLTWTQLRTTNYGTLASPTRRLTVFFAKSNSANNTNVGSADFAGVSQTGCIVRVVEVPFADMHLLNATNALVQIVHGGNNVNTNAVATFATLIGARNLAIAFVGASLNSANMAVESGWTKESDQNYNNPATEGTVAYQLKSTDTSVLLTNAASIDWACVAIEVRQEGTP